MRTPPFLHGPLPRLPAPVDAVARAWAASTGRVRALLRVVVGGLLLLAAGGGLLRGPWGPPVEVLVTTTDVQAGAPVTAADTTLATWPTDLVAPDALRSEGALPAGALALGPLPAGTVLTPRHLVADGPGRLAVPGTAVVGVDATLLPPLQVGTRLDLAVPGLDGTTTVAARDAVVVADDGTWRWLRVERADVGAVAAGVSGGRLVAAVLPPARPAASP